MRLEERHWHCKGIAGRGLTGLATRLRNRRMGASQLCRKLWPKNFGDLRRYGRDHDGGYVMPASSFLAADSLLSFGLNFDWSFEREFALAHPGTTIHAYDPTVGKGRFLRAGFWALLGASYSRREWEKFLACCDYFRFFQPPIVHFREWIGAGAGRLGVAAAAARLPSSAAFGLKIDIEGSEYEIFEEIVALAGRIEFLAIELHDVEAHAEEILAFTEKLSATHVVAHLHGNNYAPLCSDGSMPQSIEVVYVRRTGAPTEAFAGELPRAGLDQPNNRKFADAVIRRA